MGDLRLGDWITIIVWLAGVGAALLAGMFLIALWPRIVSIVSCLARRALSEGAARRAYRQQVYDHALMPSRSAISDLASNDGSWRSPAVEHSLEQAGSGVVFPVPTLWEQLGSLSDDELLDILARVKDATGNPKYADSRIAKFIGGRVEDRVAQVRDARGKEPPMPKPAALLRVRDNGMERLIAKYGK